jgi:hypothetical protein
MMTFKFQVTDSVEIFKDPIGHYHHWTVLVGVVLEGTIRQSDIICIPAVGGAKLCATILSFDSFHNRLGLEISIGQHATPIGVLVGHPAPSKNEINLGVAARGSPEEFHDLILWALRHRPARLIHDRGSNGLGFSCAECTRILYKHGNVLHKDFELLLQNLIQHHDPYISRRAQEIIDRAVSEEKYIESRELQKKTIRQFPKWMFWKRT